MNVENQHRVLIPRSSVAVVVVATLMLAIGGTGGAVAGSLITGKQIKNGTITSADIKNRSITNADLAASARKPGTTGKSGAPGAEGPRGLSAWETMPTGTSVSGPLFLSMSASGFSTTGSGHTITLPARTSSRIGFDDIKYAASYAGVEIDAPIVDPACTGSFAAPTAPPGKVCIYLNSVSGIARLGRAELAIVPDRSFSIVFWPTAGAATMTIIGAWAYTAP